MLTENNIKKRMVENCSFPLSAIGFFHGASQDGLCVAGGILKINQDHFFRLRLNYVRSAYTKVELIALWCLCKVVELLLGLSSLRSGKTHW